MCAKLKDALEADLPGKVEVTAVPVDPDGDHGRGKVYTIAIDGEMYFDFQIPNGADPKVNKAPNDGWKTPLNFETHEKYFGPGKGETGGEGKEKMYQDLKTAIAAKA